jgi:hypothetical protein
VSRSLGHVIGRKEVTDMWQFLFIAFLIAHGVVHLVMWVPKPEAGKEAPFDASYSWLLGSQKGLAATVALATAAILIVAGFGLWAHTDWWRAAAVVGLAASFGLMVVYFTPWFLFIEGVNAALFVSIVWLSWPSKTMVGA